MLWTLIFASINIGHCIETISLQVISPQPYMTGGNELCDITYQAVKGEPLVFRANASVKTKNVLSIMVAKSGDYWPICSPTDCADSVTCDHNCVVSSAVSADYDGMKYEILSSSTAPESELLGSKLTVCVSVSSAKALTFTNTPNSSLSLADRNLTLEYSVKGYPLPATFSLLCNNVLNEENTQGTFELTDIMEGETCCNVTASNRISVVHSEPVRITIHLPTTVTAAPASLPSVNTTIEHPPLASAVSKDVGMPSASGANESTTYIAVSVVALLVAGAITGVVILKKKGSMKSLSECDPIKKRREARESGASSENKVSSHVTIITTTYQSNIFNAPITEVYGPNSIVTISNGSDQQHGAQNCGGNENPYRIEESAAPHLHFCECDSPGGVVLTGEFRNCPPQQHDHDGESRYLALSPVSSEETESKVIYGPYDSSN